MPLNPLVILSGTSHPELAAAIAKQLKIKLHALDIHRFASGEVYAKPEHTVRGADVFVVQTATESVNEDLMELFVILDALKRSFAEKIHVVMPHYAYARQDRVAEPREPISAKLVADLMSTAGADHLITMKLHSDQEQGFFNFPVDNLNTNTLFAEYFTKKKLKNPVVVSPDAGGAKDAKKFADLLNAPLAIIHKSRPRHNQSEVQHVVGDVQGKTCILYDDMIDTAGSIASAAEALRERGAHEHLYAAATHPIFSPPATERLIKSRFKEVVVTDSMPVPAAKKFDGLTILPTAPFLATIIRHVHDAKSVTKAMNMLML